jgi:hypothetical protein
VLSLKNGGNVGIGATNPAQKLVVNGGIHAYGNITTPASGTHGLLMDYYIADSRFWSRGTTGGGTRGGFKFYQLEADGTNQITSFALDTSGNASFGYDVDISSDLIVDGNVGIGTDSPSSMLNVNTTGTSNFGLKLSRNDSATDGFEFTYTPSSAVAFIDAKYPASSGQVYGDIVFRHNVGGSQTERMRLEADGGNVIIQEKVGIGTDDPKELLHIYQQGTVSNYYDEGALQIGGPSTSYGALLSYHGSSSGRVSLSSLYNTGGANATLSFGFGGINTSGRPTNEVLTVNQAGNVGIGTIYPTSLGGGAKLSVNQAADGNIVFARGGSTRQVQIGTTSTTGYINADNTSGGLTFNVNTTERMRIDSSGQVYFKSSTDYKIGLNDSAGTNQWWLKSYTNGDFALHENGAGDQFTIQAGGNVGIGTTSPVAKFEVSDGSSSITLQEYNNGAAIFLDGSNGDFIGGDYFHILADGVGYLGLGGYGGGATPLNINFQGNVGIGTNSPSATLEIIKNQSSATAINVLNNSSGGSARLRVGYDVSNCYDIFRIGSSADIIQNATQSSANIIWQVGGSEKVRILSSGGITFNGDTATANALDDYEEGSWTPTYASSSATVTNVTYASTRAGRYIKVGNVVHLWGRIETSGLSWSSSSGAVYVDGIPFTVTDILSGPSFYAGAIGYSTAFGGEEPKMLAIHGTERIYLYYHSSTTSNISNLSPTDTSSSSNSNDLIFQITYRTG